MHIEPDGWSYMWKLLKYACTFVSVWCGVKCWSRVDIIVLCAVLQRYVAGISAKVTEDLTIW